MLSPGEPYPGRECLLGRTVTVDVFYVCSRLKCYTLGMFLMYVNIMCCNIMICRA